MANTMKKNINIIKVSIRSLIAANNAFSIFLRALILEIVLKGLRTRKERKELRFVLYPSTT